MKGEAAAAQSTADDQREEQHPRAAGLGVSRRQHHADEQEGAEQDRGGRQRLAPQQVVDALAGRRRLARLPHLPDQQPRNHVDNDRHQQQDRAQFDQGGPRDAARLIQAQGDFAGDRRAQRVGVPVDLGHVADDHDDRHGLAQGAAQGEEAAADDAGPGVGQHHVVDGLPARRPQRQRAFPLRARHRLAHVEGNGGDVGQDHDGED